MNLLASLANVGWLAASLPAHRSYLRALAHPADAQARWLRTHLQRNADTAYGRSLRADTIGNYREFARRVPVVDYDELQPWIDRIKRGDSAVLTRDPVKRLVPTSGSTAARKLIPYTASLQQEFNAAIGPWLVDLSVRHPSLPLGPAYWSVTPWSESTGAERSAVPIGFSDDAEYLGRLRARLIGSAMAVPSSVRHIQELTDFRRTVLVHLLCQPELRLISVWHPSFLLLLLDTLRSDWNGLLDRMARQHRMKRLRQLESADPTQPETIWPKLRLVSCWADAHAQGPAAELQRRLPHIAVQAKGLLATEAVVTMPFNGRHPLAVRSHFFEFIDDDGAVHPVEEVRAGRCYEVVVTTGGGLWRCRLGDRVQVIGFLDRTPCLRFLGRTGNVSDRCGEKLSEAFVTEVLGAVCPQATFAMLAPEAQAAGSRYALFWEGSEERTPDSTRLDAALRANPHYAICRRLGQLDAPRVVRVSDHAYARFTLAETARGMRLGEIKPVALSTRTDWAEILTERSDPSAVQPPSS